MTKWALVTGASRGFGRFIALHLAQKGYYLCLLYHRDKKAAEELADRCAAFQVKVQLLQGDLTTLQGVENILAHLKTANVQLHLFVYNFGLYLKRKILQVDFSQLSALFFAHLHTPFLLTKHLADALIENRGKIVFIGTSGLSSIRFSYDEAAYMLSKQALLGLTRAIAAELAPAGVTVNMLSPGHMEHSSVVPSHLPMNRRAQADDLLRALDFLIDPANNYLTGQNIEVAGAVQL